MQNTHMTNMDHDSAQVLMFLSIYLFIECQLLYIAVENE